LSDGWGVFVSSPAKGFQVRSAGGQAIVIGGGQNGLAAATLLAAAGRPVVVLERREVVGGLAGAVEFHPGYRVPGILHDEGLVAAGAVAKLGLEAHGLRFREAPPVYLAEAAGPGILLYRDA
jgi:phytoene dehydrogenase-like protein